MLRKISLFLDSSLEHLGDGVGGYENAVRLRSGIIELVEEISVFKVANDCPPEQHLANVGSELEKLLGGDCSGVVQAFSDASTEVHRLEFALSYPWEDEPDEGDVRRREIHMDVNFFKKAERQPFYKMNLWISSKTGSVHEDYWGPWPKAKSPARV